MLGDAKASHAEIECYDIFNKESEKVKDNNRYTVRIRGLWGKIAGLGQTSPCGCHGLTIPVSVMRAVMSSWGTTSKDGLKTLTSGADGLPWKPRTS